MNSINCDFCLEPAQTSNLVTTNENICSCCTQDMSEERLSEIYDAHTTNPENYEVVQQVMLELNQL